MTLRNKIDALDTIIKELKKERKVLKCQEDRETDPTKIYRISEEINSIYNQITAINNRITALYNQSTATKLIAQQQGKFPSSFSFVTEYYIFINITTLWRLLLFDSLGWIYFNGNWSLRLLNMFAMFYFLYFLFF